MCSTAHIGGCLLPWILRDGEVHGTLLMMRPDLM